MFQQILAEYDLQHTQSEVEPIKNGLINQTWRIKNSHGDFILQRINDGVFKHPSAIAFNLRMLDDYLALTYPEYLFMAPGKTCKNEEMVFIEGKGYFRIFPFVKQSHTINAAQKPGQAFEAAKAFGKFTRLLSHFPVEKLQITLPNFHNLSLRYSQFFEALENGNKNRIEQSQELIWFIKEHRNIADTYESILINPAFRQRVTHHDTKISNVLFDDKDKGLCVIDLDTVMPGYFISDVGDMMRTYLSPVSEEEKDISKIEIRADYFKAIAKGYLSEMNEELSTEEKNHFIYAGKFMIYMQALRFITDYINNDVYYGAKYEGQNFVRANNQVTLLKRLLEKEKDLIKIISS
ncbi:MAG: aminoglycoside phosphotransferase family protein [Ginsengibacter sp.]